MPVSDLTVLMAEIVAACEAVSGISFAPAHPPDQASHGPFAIVYLSNGEAGIRSSAKVEHRSEITVHVGLALQNMAHADTIVLPLGQKLIKALFQGLYDGTINPQNFEDIRYVYGPFVWGGMQMFGWSLTLENVLTFEALTP